MGRVSVFDPLRDFVRRLVRKHMRPVTPDEAAEKREMFGIIYVLSALGLFCSVSYSAFSTAKVKTEDERLNDYLRSSTGDKPITIVRLKGFDFSSTEKVEIPVDEVNKLKESRKLIQ